jgi:hypothetical protein
VPSNFPTTPKAVVTEQPLPSSINTAPVALLKSLKSKASQASDAFTKKVSAFKNQVRKTSMPTTIDLAVPKLSQTTSSAVVIEQPPPPSLNTFNIQPNIVLPKIIDFIAPKTGALIDMMNDAIKQYNQKPKSSNCPYSDGFVDDFVKIGLILNEKKYPKYRIFRRIQQLYHILSTTPKCGENLASITKTTTIEEKFVEINEIFINSYNEISTLDNKIKYAETDEMNLKNVKSEFDKIMNLYIQTINNKSENNSIHLNSYITKLYDCNDQLENIKKYVATSSITNMLKSICDSYNSKVSISYKSQDKRYCKLFLGTFNELIKKLLRDKDEIDIEIYHLVQELNRVNQLVIVVPNGLNFDYKFDKLQGEENDNLQSHGEEIIKLFKSFIEYYKINLLDKMFDNTKQDINKLQSDLVLDEEKSECIKRLYQVFDDLWRSKDKTAYDEVSLGGNRKRPNLTRHRRQTHRKSHHHQRKKLVTRRRRRRII